MSANEPDAMPAGHGRYRATALFTMAGTWNSEFNAAAGGRTPRRVSASPRPAPTTPRLPLPPLRRRSAGVGDLDTQRQRSAHRPGGALREAPLSPERDQESYAPDRFAPMGRACGQQGRRGLCASCARTDERGHFPKQPLDPHPQRVAGGPIRIDRIAEILRSPHRIGDAPMQAIVLVNRVAGSGTRAIMAKYLFDGDDSRFAPSAAEGENAEVAQAVHDTAGAVSYLGVAYLTRADMRVFAIDQVQATRATIQSGAWPISGRGYAITKGSASAAAQAFLTFVASPEFQNSAAFAQLGFV